MGACCGVAGAAGQYCPSDRLRRLPQAASQHICSLERQQDRMAKLRSPTSWPRVAAAVVLLSGAIAPRCLAVQEADSVAVRLRGDSLVGSVVRDVGQNQVFVFLTAAADGPAVPPRSALATADGRFAFVGVAPGEYVLRVVALGYHGTRVVVKAGLMDADPLTVPVYDVPYLLGDPPEASAPDAGVSGRLRCLSSGRRAPAVTIAVTASDSILTGATVQVAGDGHFAVANLPPRAHIALIARRRGRLVGVRPFDTFPHFHHDDAVFYVRC